MSSLKISDFRKSYGAVEVIDGVNLDIEQGEFVVFVGPSGCGKTTLLRMVAGLEEITSGTLTIGGKVCNEVAPRDRGIAMVFQSYALYPHMTVEENMGFGLKLAGAPREVRRAKVLEVARILRMETLLKRKPASLSGGQRQRVAIGRALVRAPGVFLFDEPLSNLDAALRVEMRAELLQLHQSLGATMIYVTHDQVEAMTMADKIVVLDKGNVQQVGAPLELYNQPANLFVAGFIGAPKMNLIRVSAAATEGPTCVEGPDLARTPVRFGIPRTAAGGNLTFGVRPHHLRVDGNGPLSGNVVMIERLGNETIISFRAPSGQVLIAAVAGDETVHLGDSVRFGFAADKCHLFGPDGVAMR
jgi:multiple sugar transport system ATP-binding protein